MARPDSNPIIHMSLFNLHSDIKGLIVLFPCFAEEKTNTQN